MLASGAPGSGAVSKATQTDDDWHEIKADVKQLVQALRSLDPRSETVETKREFHCDSEIWLDPLRPTSERLKTFAAVLVFMFIRNERGSLILGGVEVGRWWLPTFADKLTLSLKSGPRDVSPGYKSPELVAQIREYIMRQRAQAYCDASQVDDTSTEWQWWHPIGGDCTLYYVHGGGEQVEHRTGRRGTTGVGLWLRLVRAPIQDGVLDLRWVNLALAHTSRWNYSNPLDESIRWDERAHFASVVYFLGVFAGFWPSRNERLKFSCQFDAHWSDRWYLQVHFRYFAGVNSLMVTRDTDGLQCHREQGRFVSDTVGLAPHFFEEKRVSVFGLLSASRAIHRGNYGLEWRGGLEGAIVFQIAVLTSVHSWGKEWNRALNRIEDCLRVQLGQTLCPQEIDKWMFDDNFERSKLYFTILQILRIFGECIRNVSDDLHPLDDLFLNKSNFPMLEMRQD
ncbi:hypothetical protein E0Z10_g1615 [Xylaria hypoxylon]|uniref:Uncharacterized protein n=1 Tax=Xylaria hypoxylon TaxID=37992 RepID=A0A4Z0ZED6_9PEZI|nr:hypothetical protein E0Z10_g1615 [Xylaria hypoxylon]